MNYIKRNVIAIIASAALLFAVSFAYGQYREALEHNRQIILRCVEKEAKEGVSYDACMTLWKPFLVPFVSRSPGSYR